MTKITQRKDKQHRNKIDLFFKLKNNFFYNKKKPNSEKYPFELIDPFHLDDKLLAYKRFHLVGDNWLEVTNPKPIAFLWGFNDWKFGFTSDYLPEYRCAFSPRKSMGALAIRAFLKLKEKPSVFLVWGYTENRYIRFLAWYFKIQIIRVEDAFIRSAELGASHATPYSLVFDKTGLYYDARSPSGLENILNTYVFKENPDLLTSAKKTINDIVELKLSKYNPPELNTAGISFKIKTRQRIAILGQVDGDASLRYGNPRNWSSIQLIKLAKYEHPEAEVFYRPHPEVFKGYQKSKFKNKLVEKFCTITSPEEPILDFLKTIDHVYTITSLTGFEALIRGIKVTCVGAPFYSGWGLTDDRVKIKRRKAKLSLEELFAGAYLLYPRYLANLNDSHVGLRAACLRINSDRYIGLSNTCVDALVSDVDNSALVAKTPYWPQVIFNHKNTLTRGVFSKLLSEVDFSCLLMTGQQGALYQTVILFLISGALPDNDTRSDFINRVRSYVEPKILNELLLYLNRYFPGDYIAFQLSWLLTGQKELTASTRTLESGARVIIERRNFENRIADNEIGGDDLMLATPSPVIGDESKIWMALLDNHMAERKLDDAINILKPLLLSNYSIPNMLKHALAIAEFTFDYISASKLSKFSQGIDILAGNRNAIISEVKASKFFPLKNETEFYCLLSKALILKPDNIALMQFIAGLFPEVFDEIEAKKILEGMLSLDNDISSRKAQAYLAIERADKAVKIMQKLIRAGDNSDMTTILYSQSLSYNDRLNDAIEVMKTARGLKLTSANIRESLRLCVLSSNYNFSLELIDLAEENKIPLGDMHKRKAYFGNKMIKEAFETFTEIQLVKTVAKYFGDKYYKFDIDLDCNESVLALAIFGPGDEIRFASIYNLIKDVLKTENISVSCNPRLLSLFSRSFTNINFIPVSRPRNIELVDLNNYSKVPGSDILSVVDNNAVEAIEENDNLLFVTDLLHRALPNIVAFPGVAYLQADERTVDSFRLRLPSETILVGLSWRSSLTTHSRNEHYLTIEELEPLFAISGVTFVNLQYDECDDELAWVEERHPNKIVNFDDIDQYNDFESVAALMKCMDLIISSATTVVELAGALGCPTWLFSNSSELDWRKIDSAGTDVWHNNTTIVEGAQVGNKSSLVAELNDRLIQYVIAKSVKEVA
tara:strand:+ start:3792 stop:7304 length:3513 start_codon:yes stop_codon:yes gene_type:complete